IGFSTLIYNSDRTLFNVKDFGIIDAGVRATVIDLDMPEEVIARARPRDTALCSFVWTCTAPGVSDLLAVINFRCPDWFEPVKRRLAINDLTWLDTRQPPNNSED